MKNIQEIFSQLKAKEAKPLFVFELANNHMGDLEHGLKTIREFSKISQEFDFYFAFKFQFRNIDTFIHPDYKKRMDLKYIKRFTETSLNQEQFIKLKAEVEKAGFISICTPFDEPSVDLIEEMNFDVLKIASCSFSDWPLLERIVKTDKPIIASTGGVKLEDIDKVVSFLKNRQKNFILMHCVGEYPAVKENLKLGQIDLLKERYQDVPIGYSTHEEPDNFEAVKVAVGKGVKVFEKHVALETDKYPKNAYSVTPDQAKKWLQAAQEALAMCGSSTQRSEFSAKELADIRQFQRGAFVNRAIKKGEKITTQDTFYAFPNTAGQILANDMSKYTHYTAKKDLKKNEPIMAKEVEIVDVREKVYAAVKKINDLLVKANVPISNQWDFELSHHYGLDKFYEIGASIVSCFNREYCKKLIVLLPKQKHPVHHHQKKEETFHVLWGDVTFTFGSEKKQCQPGDIITIERGLKHAFESSGGGIFEEISTTHYKNDSFYEDDEIMNNPNRKTVLTHWVL